MKKLTLIIGLLMAILFASAQKKKAHWRESGSGFIGFNITGTTSKTFSLDGKDSLSYKIQSGPKTILEYQHPQMIGDKWVKVN